MRWAKPALTVATCVFMCAAAEVAVRARQYARDGSFFSIGGTRDSDAATGLVIPKPGSFDGRIRINSLGFRGPEIAPARPRGVVRLAFVGASTTFCAEVTGNDQAWPYLVWSDVQTRYRDLSFDFVNAGIPGATTAASRVNFERRVKPLSPDVVVLYEGFNDAIADARLVAEAHGIAIARLEESGLASRSLFWLLVRKNLQVLEARRLARSDRSRLELPATLADRFAAELRALIDETSAVTPVVAVATLSSRLRPGQSLDEQLQAADAAGYYLPFLRPSDIQHLYETYNQAIRSVAREHGVILIEGEHTIPADAQHFRDTIHFADAGSERMGARVVDALTRSTRFADLLERRRGR